ncbi:MAG: hypothetical protein ACR2I2_10385 [Bryobacteraceae bacterium]
MAELEFEIKAEHGPVSADTFRDAVTHSIWLLREYDAAISGIPRGTLRWYINRLRSNGSLFFAFRSQPKPMRKPGRIPDVSGQVAHSLVSGWDELEHKATTPPYLSEMAMQRAYDFAGLIGKNGATGFIIASNSETVEITKATAEHIQRLLPIKRKAIGSVEGKLESINIHKHPRFIVYHAVTKKAVTCEFEADKLMGEIKDALGKRVTVYGTLHKNEQGETRRVTMERLNVFDPNVKRLHFIEGDDPDFANASSTEEYLRIIRGG